MYGRDPQLPTDAILVPELETQYVDVQDFQSEMVKGISQAWKLARENIERAQKYQKSHTISKPRIQILRWETESLFICLLRREEKHTNLHVPFMALFMWYSYWRMEYG